MTARKPSRKPSDPIEVPPTAKPVTAEVTAAAPATAPATGPADADAPAESAPPPPAKRARARRTTAAGGTTPRPRRGGGSKNVLPATALDDADRGRLLAGEHHDPHGVLGAHPASGGVLFRTLRPHARSVAVVVKGKRAELQSDGDGFFSGVLPLPGVPEEYLLRVAYEDNTIEVEDPYRFLPAIGELDLHLIGEGRHEELWNCLL